MLAHEFRCHGEQSHTDEEHSDAHPLVDLGTVVYMMSFVGRFSRSQAQMELCPPRWVVQVHP